jgi:hypothetical protein
LSAAHHCACVAWLSACPASACVLGRAHSEAARPRFASIDTTDERGIPMSNHASTTRSSRRIRSAQGRPLAGSLYRAEHRPRGHRSACPGWHPRRPGISSCGAQRQGVGRDVQHAPWPARSTARARRVTAGPEPRRAARIATAVVVGCEDGVLQAVERAHAPTRSGAARSPVSIGVPVLSTRLMSSDVHGRLRQCAIQFVYWCVLW